MGILDRTSIANVVSGAVLLLAAVYAAYTNNHQLVRDLAMLAAGYLFGSTVPRLGGGRQ